MTAEATATNTATVATNTFKKALVATGLGAIVVAVGLLVANMDKLVKVFSASAKEAERQAKAMQKLKQNIEDVNQTVNYYEKEIKKLTDAHRKELKDMDNVIEKMKAQGKTEAAISAQQEKFNKRRKAIYQEEVNDINKAQKAIEDYFKKEKNI
jgi:septal ring factor EnvC (AmiA/AmiB activator)